MNEIEKLLPHREPFLFVDELESVTDTTITGYRIFNKEEAFFRGHFPDHPVVPGVILLEALAQCGGAGVNRSGRIKNDTLFFLASISNVKFRQPVFPGDRIRFEIENLRISDRVIRQKGVAYKGDKKAVEAEWMSVAGEV